MPIPFCVDGPNSQVQQITHAHAFTSVDLWQIPEITHESPYTWCCRVHYPRGKSTAHHSCRYTFTPFEFMWYITDIQYSPSKPTTQMSNNNSQCKLRQYLCVQIQYRNPFIRPSPLTAHDRFTLKFLQSMKSHQSRTKQHLLD